MANLITPKQVFETYAPRQIRRDKQAVKANAEWLTNMLNFLHEGGQWVYPDAGKVFIKRGNMLQLAQ